MLKPEERLIILASLAQPTEAEQKQLSGIVHRLAPEWDTVEALARDNAILPKVHHALQQQELWDLVPTELQGPWLRHVEQINRTNQARLDAARPLMEHLVAKRIPVIMLKGIYFAESLYQHANYKRMNDVDFLVKKPDARKLYPIYEKLGFFCVAPLMGDSAEKQEKYSHHMPPFVNRGLDCVLGTHWGLISPLTRYKLDYEAIWSRAIPFDFYGIPLYAMSPEDNLHHLCVHLPYYKTGVRELMDIYNLIRLQGDAIDWDRLTQTCRAAGTQELVFHALSLTQALVPLPAVENLLEAITPDVKGFYLRDTRGKIENPALILRSRSTQVSKVERAYGEFSMTWDLKEKSTAYFAMWKHFLFPPRREVEKMNYLTPGTCFEVFLYYPFNPIRIARLLAKDLGWKLLWLVTLKEVVDLVKCLYMTLTRPGEEVQTIASFAHRFNLTPEQLQQLKGALE